MKKIIVAIDYDEIRELMGIGGPIVEVFSEMKVEGRCLMVKLWREDLDGSIGLPELPDLFETEPGEHITTVSLRKARELLSKEKVT